FEESEEHGVTDGLGLLPGRVARLPDEVAIPHIGWNRLRPGERGRSLFAGLDSEPWMYFVHSYAPAETPESVTLATALHGRSFAAAADRGRVFGVQFHPEKSGSPGLRLLSNFLETTDGSAAGD
ncbi:MAG: imidazole glycerol phosphate synthase subunit HisH, partial [Thermoanaerobaculia bacterium]|nr:imidazole glycerol phosphate synthase subunit HisH [Thermoanaerobaculia bacterium]